MSGVYCAKIGKFSRAGSIRDKMVNIPGYPYFLRSGAYYENLLESIEMLTTLVSVDRVKIQR